MGADGKATFSNWNIGCTFDSRMGFPISKESLAPNVDFLGEENCR